MTAGHIGSDGEPLPKQRHVEDQDGDSNRKVAIYSLINRASLARKVVTVPKKGKATDRDMTGQLAAARPSTERVKHYDFLSNLAHAAAEFNMC